MWVFISLVSVQAVVHAVLCSVVANSNGRSPVAWFTVGPIFSVFGFIATVAIDYERNRVEK